MRNARRNLRRAIVIMTFAISPIAVASADDTVWTGNTDNDFFTDANWSDGAPGSLDDVAIIEGGNNLPAIIGESTGTVEIGAVRLGVDDLGSHVVQNGGTLVIDGLDVGQESIIGDFATEDVSWVMNNDATILYGDPFAQGNGFDTDGNGQDFDVGKNMPEGVAGRMELHGNAALHIGDDLKLADTGNGHAVITMDGNSRAMIGSGISASVAIMQISGDALLVSGNSSAPGDSQNGRTNEGYLTLSTGDSEEATIEVSDSGRVYARTLQQRGGISTISLQDNGEFHVFDVFNHAEPDLGQATVTGSSQGPQRTSHIGSGASTTMNILLADDSKMSFDTDLEDTDWSGLAVSGGNNRGNGGDGGVTLIDIRDRASFEVAQDLHLTMGVNETAESTLKVTGPNAHVYVGGDLRMALTEFDDESLGTATLHAVITDRTHSTITVGGTALISNGDLVVEFDGYTPIGGESYELLTADLIDGASFRSVTLPDLPTGPEMTLTIDANRVLLSFAGTPGDFNGDGMLDATDIDLLSAAVLAGGNDPLYDVNGDSIVNNEDRVVWVGTLKNTYFGDANLDGEFNSGDFVVVFQQGKYEDGIAGNAGWADGDWNGDGDFDTADFVTAFTEGGYEQGPKNGVAAVPEPTGCLLMLTGLAMLTRRRRTA